MVSGFRFLVVVLFFNMAYGMWDIKMAGGWGWQVVMKMGMITRI